MHTIDIFDDTNIHVSSFANTSFLNNVAKTKDDKTKKEKVKEGEKQNDKGVKKEKERIKINESPDPLKPEYNS
jgi:hypothetical protein